MKYALVISEKRINQSKIDLEINLGDAIQWIAIKNIYKKMGISNSNIVEISATELRDYDGEELILPINYMVCNNERCPYLNENSQFMFSKKIKPIFLGLSVKKGYFVWNEDNISYLKQFAPIGCRDYSTYVQLKERGVESYIAGCITATLDRRSEKIIGNKIYFVEVPKALESYIPEKVRNECEFVYHQINALPEQFADDLYELKEAENRLQLYKNNAKLVVASRLHALIPCMAMGIPVIAVKEYFGYPFDLLGKFIPLYSYKDFDKIDWNPDPIDLEDYKRVAIECAIERLNGRNSNNQIEKLHKQYANLYEYGYKEDKQDFTVLYDLLSNRYVTNEAFEYCLWGLSENAETIYSYIRDTYPNAKLVKAVDAYKHVEFHGMKSELPDELIKHRNLLVIATTLNVYSAAKQLLNVWGQENQLDLLGVTDGILDAIQ